MIVFLLLLILLLIVNNVAWCDLVCSSDRGDLQSVYSSQICALANTSSPCMCKAMCHIQELTDTLDHWAVQVNPAPPKCIVLNVDEFLIHLPKEGG